MNKNVYCRGVSKALNPKYTTPSRSYLSDTFIPTWCGVEKSNVIIELKDGPKLAITSDIITVRPLSHCYRTLHKPGQCKTEGPPHQDSVKQKDLATRPV